MEKSKIMLTGLGLMLAAVTTFDEQINGDGISKSSKESKRSKERKIGIDSKDLVRANAINKKKQGQKEWQFGEFKCWAINYENAWRKYENEYKGITKPYKGYPNPKTILLGFDKILGIVEYSVDENYQPFKDKHNVKVIIRYYSIKKNNQNLIGKRLIMNINELRQWI